MVIQGVESSASIIISVVSLSFAIASFVRSSKAQDLQDRVNKMELQIKEHELNAIGMKQR